MKQKHLARQYTTAALALALSLTSSPLPLLVQAEEVSAEVQSDRVNLALNKPAVSSAIEGKNDAAKAVDGKESTYWAAPNPSEITVDLEGYYKLSEINLMMYFSPSTGAVERYYEYEIYGSTDQKEFTLLAEKTSTDYEVPEGTSYYFEEDAPTVRWIKVKILKTHAEGQPQNNTGHIKELRVYGNADPDFQQPKPEEKDNIAKNKMAYAPSNEGNNTASRAVDGNKGTYWAAGGSTYIEVDLEGWYDLSEITVIPYYSDARFYHYEVSVSANGYEYTKVGEKTDDKNQTSAGETYALDGITARYVRVDMLSNSKNTSVHVNEIEVYGKENTEYTPETDEDAGNVALNKPARSYSNNAAHPASAINDGARGTLWSALYYPAYVDIDLEENHSLKRLVVFPDTSNMSAYYQYAIYTSMDGVNFDLLCEKTDTTPVNLRGDVFELDGTEARFVRVYLEYCSSGNTGSFQEVRVYGDPTGSDLQERAPIDVPDFQDTEYAAAISEEETLQEVRGVLSRVIGEKYNDWFEFELAGESETGNDWYEISDHDGEIHIAGNKGLSLTTGLNHYLKYFCNVSVTQQARQVAMPENVVPVGTPIRKETPYAVRYAYNYCTHSYTMAFWGETEWQNELDWLALNGFNAILDITGQEEVWRRFMGELGYSTDEIKDWLVGPGYYGWQYMANMENVNGPIPDNWFADRTELARSNQRKMRALGMTPILQGYSGMVPNSIRSKDPEAQIIAQGLWNGMQRPAMLKTNTETYKQYAEMFYQAQKEVYGDISQYYATDPFHEGGNTGGIGRDIVGRAMLDEMKKYDEDAVWVIQSWSFQPALLQNITAEEKQNNILLLDLNGTKGPKYTSTDEFAGSNWVYCMLENYGGRSGINGNLQKYATIPSQIKDKTSHMRGMGISPEGTNNNPARYDLFLEMMWETEDMDLEKWVDHYVERRYGSVTPNARKAWAQLLLSGYQASSNYADPPESIVNARPQFSASKSAPNGHITISYNKKTLEKALEILMKDYDLLQDNEGYRYDVTDLLRQVTANSAYETYVAFTDAYNRKDQETFETESEKFLDMVAFQDEVLNANENFMVGTWLQPSLHYTEGQDEFTARIFELNAKALITTWAPYYCWGVYDYANREYGGLTADYYLPRWQEWISRLSKDLAGEKVSGTKEITTTESHRMAWEWARSDKKYPTEPTGDLKALYRTFAEHYSLKNQKSDPLLIDSADLKVSTSLPAMAGYPLSNALDGNPGTMWSTAYGDLEPYEIVFELDEGETINKFSILPRGWNSRATGNGDILGIELWASEDGEHYEKFAEASFPEDGEERLCTFDPIQTKYVKLVITDFLIWNSNHSIKSVTAAEMRFYRAFPALESSSLEFRNGRLTGISKDTPASVVLSQIEVPEGGSVVLKRNGTVLEAADTVEEGDVLEYTWKDSVVQTWSVVLSKEADFSALNALISQCEQLHEKDYTPESWKAFSAVLTDAIGVQVSPEADQAEIDAACKALQAAMDALEKAEPEIPETPDSAARTLLEMSAA